MKEAFKHILIGLLCNKRAPVGACEVKPQIMTDRPTNRSTNRQTECGGGSPTIRNYSRIIEISIICDH